MNTYSTAEVAQSGDVITRESAAGPERGGGLWGAIRFEWVKLWSVRSTWWCLATGVILMVLWAGVVGYDYSYEDTAHPAPTEPFPVGDTTIQAAQLAQFAIMALAMLVITSEYASGSIRATLQCVPSRFRMLTSKAILVGLVTFVYGLVLAGAGTISGGIMLEDLALVESGELMRQLPSVAAYLALVGMFTLGVGFILRSAVGTLSVSMLLLVVLPLITRGIGAEFIQTISDFLPGSAGTYLLDGGGDRYGAGPALLILAAWAVAALGFGYSTLKKRDA
ncbi:ABC transporter permease subunit [Paractinoplanes rishiriensis]|uniref:ABC transporter n=1 Tax=Paractinoplanes rishiriensis TaxID=1050105 RepID=A0A919K9Q6_9ACTN|nr:ABC transporter permease subunit [Actinoplanes rishiriensis]GIF02375.1 ABC transporter [Actinoplanes rishiriensis]